jgi:hypothetical protein
MSRTSVLIALAGAAFSAALAGPQTSTTDAVITGCLQRAPSALAKEGQFVLMNAGNSPMGSAVDTPAVTPAEPARGPEPLEKRTGGAGVRQETGGVTYLLQGGTDLESKVGQRVEVVGTIGPQITAKPRRPTMKQPIQKVQVKQLRAIAPSC